MNLTTLFVLSRSVYELSFYYMALAPHYIIKDKTSWTELLVNNEAVDKMNIKRMEIVLATRRPFRDTNSFREKHRKNPILEIALNSRAYFQDFIFMLVF